MGNSNMDTDNPAVPPQLSTVFNSQSNKIYESKNIFNCTKTLGWYVIYSNFSEKKINVMQQSNLIL